MRDNQCRESKLEQRNNLYVRRSVEATVFPQRKKHNSAGSEQLRTRANTGVTKGQSSYLDSALA